MNFFRSFVKELIDTGHTVDIATNENGSEVPVFFKELGCVVYQISCPRTPLSKDNIDAAKKIKRIVQEGEYDIVHCHTPIAAVCTRLACKALRKKGVKVFYTAHGFHFYKGAPMKNWLLYYPIEWLCSFWTDTLITINREDYERAKKHFHARKTEYVPGVGIDIDQFANAVVDKNAKRQELGILENGFLLFSVGELNKNKNHEVVIRALAELKNRNIHYAIAGKGNLKEYLEEIAERLGVKEQVHLLGYRNDVAELYKAADAYVLPSIREGLNVSIMEAMASGLPVICSRIRGNVDMVDISYGMTCKADSVDDFAVAIQEFFDDTNHRIELGRYAKRSAERFDVIVINEKMLDIYGYLREIHQ